eukprot:9287292-Pyramimonas_sp.AAC.1
MSVMHEAWAGVDLADTSVNASGARFLVIGGVSQQEFEASERAVRGPARRASRRATASSGRPRTSTTSSSRPSSSRAATWGCVSSRRAWASSRRGPTRCGSCSAST